MSKYFNGYASFDWSEMTKEELIIELKTKCKYISELKRKYSEDVKQKLKEKDREIEILRKKAFIDMTEKEILELKLHTRPKEIVEKIRFLIDSTTHLSGQTILYSKINDILDEILKEYGEKR